MVQALQLIPAQSARTRLLKGHADETSQAGNVHGEPTTVSPLGSVPTLWHVLHPAERPKVWSRTADGYDQEKIGLEAIAFDAVPKQVRLGRDRRKYFNTLKPGKSAGGHLFPDALDEDQKRAVLEYLKTL